jgi:hypothetical protein
VEICPNPHILVVQFGIITFCKLLAVTELVVIEMNAEETGVGLCIHFYIKGFCTKQAFIHW